MAKVVLDTGSDWLTIKACLTEAHCHKKKVQPNETDIIGDKQQLGIEDINGILKADTVYFVN